MRFSYFLFIVYTSSESESESESEPASDSDESELSDCTPTDSSIDSSPSLEMKLSSS